MKGIDVVSSAVNNTFRSKTRTLLTVLAIFIGAFTLTITSGLGTGINRYIADTVAAIGAEDVMTVSRTPTDAKSNTDGPREYDAVQVTSGSNVPSGPGQERSTVDPITPERLDELAGIDGVLAVQPNKTVSVDYVQHDGGTKYQVGIGGFVTGQSLQLAAGTQLDQSASQLQVALPASFTESLGYAANEDAIGSTVDFGLTAANGSTHTVTATVVAVTEAGLGGGTNAIPNTALIDQMSALQGEGLTGAAATSYASATVWFDAANSTPEDVTALQDRLTAAGYDSTTVADQLGTFQSVIDAIVLVLNAFAVISLLAAGFGIVNTLLMSVQERTREIGLMKAMGMGGGKVFGLFSLEAVFIGFLGSAIGVGVGMIAGTLAGNALGSSLFADLAGLNLIAFDPLSVTVIILIVMGIALLAGTLPAARAARADPIESLRYE
jgi:putative ABC transport system permease protein